MTEKHGDRPLSVRLSREEMTFLSSLGKNSKSEAMRFLIDQARKSAGTERAASQAIRQANQPLLDQVAELKNRLDLQEAQNEKVVRQACYDSLKRFYQETQKKGKGGAGQ